MRKIVMAAAMLLAVPAMVDAQNTVQATATIAPTSSVSGTGVVDFGTLTGATTINPAGGAGSAQRTVSYNHNVRVTFANVATALTSGGASLAVSLTCAAQTGGTWSAAAPCSSAQFDLNVGTALTQSILGFGGTIDGTAYANAAAGTYTGQLDIVVTAN